MEALNAQGNPWPTLIFVLGVAVVWTMSCIRSRIRRARARVRCEHERLTNWLPDLRAQEKERGRHRADRLTSR